jgi:hypothetical protein
VCVCSLLLFTSTLEQHAHLTDADVQADPARRILVYACRICQYDEIGENMCVYRNDLVTVTK